jgi:precorrin isomerase
MTEAYVHQLLRDPLDGAAIEARSLAQIDAEAPAHSFTPRQWRVVQRMIHASADFSLMDLVDFSADAIDSGIRALRAGATIFTDSNMIRAGVSMARLQAVHPAYGPEHLSCAVADREVAREARAAGLPRSLFAVRACRPALDGGIALFGNAPVALLELNRMVIEDGVRPALVIGMPVGFVHVVESKLELASLPVPWIAIEGRRGGSTLAVAALHALCVLAAEECG